MKTMIFYNVILYKNKNKVPSLYIHHSCDFIKVLSLSMECINDLKFYFDTKKASIKEL